MSADTAKEVQNDKTLKTKNEKDRRLREKRQNNVKRFMEEKKVGSVTVHNTPTEPNPYI